MAPERVALLVEWVLCDLAIVDTDVGLPRLLLTRSKLRLHDQLVLKLLVQLELGLHMLLPFVGFGGEVPDEDFPDDGAKKFDV